MEGSQLAISTYEKEARIRQYKTDPNINMFCEIMYRITSLATPRIIVNIQDDTKSVFDIDEKSRTQLNYWKQKLQEYILTTYPDIFKAEKSKANRGKEIST